MTAPTTGPIPAPTAGGAGGAGGPTPVPPPGPPPTPVPITSEALNIKPFLVEPILVSRLLKKRSVTPGPAGSPEDERSPYVVAIWAVLLACLLVSWSALIMNSFYRPHWDLSVLSDVWSFLSRRESADPDANAVPFLRDYPSCILTFSIAWSVPLVYGIFRSLQTLHESLDKSGCIRCDDQARAHLKSAVDDLNAKYAKHGKYSWLVLLGIVAVVTGINLRLQGHLFHFLGSDALYDQWWGRAAPVTFGGVVWIFMGTVGMYMAYAEGVVGIHYVKFLKQLKNEYKFGTNPLNPDNFYGWAKLRQAVSNLQGGLTCTFATSFAMFFFLQPAIGTYPTLLCLAAFVGMVLYVFIGSMTHIRRQVRVDRKEQIDQIIAAMPDPDSTDPSAGVRYLVALQRLRDVQKLPSMPIRNGLLFAGALSVLAPTVAIAVQVIKLIKP
ncbi:hypothetical protein ACIQCJ_11955 [Streptomyces sp. NPDC093221]|uniref:hypothetical protein n=1 Tax=unclassified Streptomyces TaxID=2593676 RepID=UPI0036EC2887